MATDVFGIIGTNIGGPIGGFIGRLIGGAIDTAISGGGGRSSSRVEGLAIQGSAYGSPIPLVFGTLRIAGNVIWSDGVIEHKESEGSGGKGGPGGGESTINRYTSSFAVALSGRKIDRIDRIWADGKLIRESDGPLSVGGQMRVYLGDEDQEVDPVIESILGVGQVPSYRGIAYVVFEDLELAEFANRVPNLTFEIVADGGQAALATIVQELASIGDIDLVDTTSLSPIITGFAVDGSVTFREAVDDLSIYHDVLSVERGRLLIMKDVPQQAVLIPEADLGARSDQQQGQALESTRIQDWELPSELLVEYLDPARDYQTNVQRARRLLSRRGGQLKHGANVAISAQDAKAAAERNLNVAWTARETATFSLTASYLALEPGDFVTTSYDGVSHPVLVEERRLSDFIVSLSGPHFASENTVANVLADSGADITQTAASQGITHYELMDVPLLPGENPSAARYLYAAGGENAVWRSATLFESLDSEVSFTRKTSSQVQARIGFMETGIGFAGPELWDEINRPIVQLYNPSLSLESMPEIALFNGANAVVVGGEVLQFREAYALGSGRYELRGLLRGRLGTESEISNHSVGDRFVFLEPAGLAAVPTNLGHIGQSRAYRAVGPLESLENTSSAIFAFKGVNLRPLSPVHVRAQKLLSGDVRVDWTRRSRLGAEWIDGADAPLGEEVESYELEVLAPDGSVLRQVNLSATDYVYTLAQQQNDFGFGISWLHVNIYQISAMVGRGAVADHQFEFL